MRGNNTAKKVLGFIFFRSAFTQRNITSIGLVILFFVVYVLAGGKIDAIPKIQTDPGTFGGVDSSAQGKAKQLPFGLSRPTENDNKAALHRPPLTQSSEMRMEGRDSKTENAPPDASPKTDESDPFQSIEKRLQERKKK